MNTIASCIVVFCLCAVLIACDGSQKAIEMNIDQLRAAEARLSKNPQDREALSFILNQLNDRRGIYRSNAAAVLGEVGEQVGESIKDQAVPALSNLLDKGDEYDKSAAARSLARFGRHAEAAVPVLRKNLVPSDRDVAWFSAKAIGNIGQPAAQAIPDLLTAIKANIGSCQGYASSFCESFIPAIGKMDATPRSAVPELEAQLNHKDPYVRMRLAVALMRIDPANRRALEILESLLRDTDAEIRSTTIEALAECRKKAEPARHLIEMSTKDDNSDVRREAADLLKLLSNN